MEIVLSIITEVMGKTKGSLNIYFAGSICGGRADQPLYETIINHLKSYGTVLTESIGRPTLTEQGNTTMIQFSYEHSINYKI